MKNIIVVIVIALSFSCSQQQYVVSDIRAQRFPIVKNDTLTPNPEVRETVQKYKFLLDKEMNRIIGYSAESMTYGRPESLLTNLTSDVMLSYANSIGKESDLSFMNVNGHRSNMPQGEISLGNVFEIYSFENSLYWVQLRGSDLIEVFKSYARLGGAGISSTARLIIKDGKLIDAKVNGEPVDKNNIYSIVTLDYLAEGNDGMQAMKNAVASQALEITLRDVMLAYIKDRTQKGQEITSQLDGRIRIEQ